jgi:hypothetical protein
MDYRLTASCDVSALQNIPDVVAWVFEQPENGERSPD